MLIPQELQLSLLLEIVYDVHTLVGASRECLGGVYQKVDFLIVFVSNVINGIRPDEKVSYIRCHGYFLYKFLQIKQIKTKQWHINTQKCRSRQ